MQSANHSPCSSSEKISNCRVTTEWFCNKQQLNKTPQNFHLFNFFITQKSQQISQADPLPFFFFQARYALKNKKYSHLHVHILILFILQNIHFYVIFIFAGRNRGLCFADPIHNSITKKLQFFWSDLVHALRIQNRKHGYYVYAIVLFALWQQRG